MPSYPPIPRVLAIAASDSSGAAGMQADLKTFEARQVYGLSALTAITAQDSMSISAVSVLPADLVAAQIRAVLDDGGADAVKTGLLFRAEIVCAVVESLKAGAAPDTLVVDPVLVAGDGRRLVDDQTIAAYRTALFPRALLITPNLDEASILTGQPVDSPESMRAAAQRLHEMGPSYVLVKGGHLESGDMLDVLYDGQTFQEYRAERLPVSNARGTGCTFAACIAAEVAKGRAVPAAVDIAKRYLTAALAAAADWHMGRGRGTLFHSLGRPPLFEE
jgi:hydroxymethylpyrimidine/phosphomethylpyrimidine kinase